MRLPDGTPLDVQLEFDPEHIVEVGRLGIAERQVIFEQRRAFVDSRLVLHPLFSPISEQVLYPKNPRFFDGLHGVFADSLPDAWGRELLRRRAQVEGFEYNTFTALDRLALIGSHGPGALQYRPTIAEPDADDINLDILAENALAILQGQESDVLDSLVRLGGSSGGARPKISVAIRDRDEMRPLSASLPNGFDAWIIKFRAPNDPRDSGPLEAAYADMARAAGLEVAETRLLLSQIGPGYFATRRFDRDSSRRLHMVSSSAALEIDWSLPGDYETLLKLTRRITRDQKGVEVVFRRGVFNFIAHNRDDHWKQHAYLMDRTGKWSVAPSFDLTFSPGPNGEHYLTLGGCSKEPETAAFVKAAESESIDSRRARDIIEEVTTAVARFSDFAKHYDISNTTTRRITKAFALKSALVASPKQRR